MDKLTLEHLSDYLPYKITGILRPQIHEVVEATGIYVDKFGSHEVQINYGGSYAMSRFKPLLHPLSTQFLTSIMPDANHLEEVLTAIENETLLQIRHDLFTTIVKNHGDIYGLIPLGLAVAVERSE